VTVAVGLAGLVVTMLVVAAMILATPGNVERSPRAASDAREDAEEAVGPGARAEASALTPTPAGRSRA